MKVVLGFFVCVFSLIILSGGHVSAAGNGWLNGAPEVDFSNETHFSWTPQCSTYYQNGEIEGVGNLPICLFGGDNPKVGITYGDSGFIRLVISYPLDDRFYVLDGPCGGIANCVYAPETDMLVVRYYGGPGLSAKVFRHVKERTHRYIDPLTAQIRYMFDESEPDFSFTNADGLPLMVESLAVSANGKWLALEYRGIGIMRINLETFEMRRVWANGFHYGWGNDPTIEMAISNDGEALAVMGERSGFSLTVITAECGDVIHVPMYNSFDSPDRGCPSAAVSPDQLISQFHGAYDPRFSDNGDRLSFVVTSNNGAAKSVGLVKHGTIHSSRIHYLALGDSFTSGEGELDSMYYASGTDEKFEKCHLSSRSYPFLFARLVGFSSAKSVACSGARIKDISYLSREYWGQGKRLGPDGLNLSLASLSQSRIEALDTFRPGRIPQDKFVEQYRPEVITVGIGGNDAGLMTKLRACLSPGVCEWANDLYRTAEEIQTLFAKLVSLYRQLIHLAPASHFYATGYPELIDPEGLCDPVTGLLLQHDERRFMKEALSYLNKVIESAAHTAGVNYINLSSTFRGHELCSGSSTPAMNGLRSGNDVKLGALLPFRLIGNESFHPTPYGHTLIAAALKQQYTETQEVRREEPPLIPAYWGMKERNIRLIAEDFVSPTAVSSDNPEITISLPNNSLVPNSPVSIEIHSEIIAVEDARVDEKGGLTRTIRLPKGFEEGLHTVHLLGTSYSGKVVELYQGIVYGKQDIQASVPSAQISESQTGALAMENQNELSRSEVLGQTTIKEEQGRRGGALTDQIKDHSTTSKVFLLGALCLSALGLIFLIVRRFRAPEDG